MSGRNKEPPPPPLPRNVTAHLSSRVSGHHRPWQGSWQKMLSTADVWQQLASATGGNSCQAPRVQYAERFSCCLIHHQNSPVVAKWPHRIIPRPSSEAPVGSDWTCRHSRSPLDCCFDQPVNRRVAERLASASLSARSERVPCYDAQGRGLLAFSRSARSSHCRLDNAQVAGVQTGFGCRGLVVQTKAL